MAAKKTNTASSQINLRMSPSEAKLANEVARRLGLNVQNAIRFLLKREHDTQPKG